MTRASQTLRGQILEDARAATEGDRNRTYGDPTYQLAAAYQIKRLLNDLYLNCPNARRISDGEWEALDIKATKIARIICGPVLHRDNYVDDAAYSAIAYECAVAAERLEERARDEDDYARERCSICYKPVEIGEAWSSHSNGLAHQSCLYRTETK